MVKFVFPAAAAVAALALAASSVSVSVSALPVPTDKWPASTGTVKLDKPQVVAAGEVFDGKMQTFELSTVQCQGQKESSKDTMVFLVEPGATLRNVIIGKNQMEGVHCEKHDCTIENVWWDDVCEDALSIKGGSATSVSKVLGGGARYADDKVVQHNGPGKVTIDGFFAEDFGKLYRSCGTCGDVKREVAISNVLAINPTSGIATVNKNFGDEASFANIHIQSTKKKVTICGWSQGVAKGEGEPGKLGDGPSPPLCQYSESDIILNGKATSGTGSTGGDAEAPATTPATTPASASAPAPAASDDGDDAADTDAPATTPVPVTPAAASDDGDDNNDDDDAETPAATTKAPKTKTPKSPKPSKTPKPSKAAKTPKPTKATKAPKTSAPAEETDEYN